MVEAKAKGEADMNFLFTKNSLPLASAHGAKIGLAQIVACLLLAWCFLAWLPTAQARDIGAALKLGTPGFGGDITIGVNETLNTRVGINFLSLAFEDDEEDDDEADIELEIGLLSFPLLLDWHPRGGNFRISGGLVINQNELSAKTTEPGSVDLNDRDYFVDSFSMDITFNAVSPYLGIGYGNAVRDVDRRWRASVDFGVMFHGTPKVRGRATASNPAQQEALNRDLDIEIADVQDDFSSLKIYPVISFGISRRF